MTEHFLDHAVAGRPLLLFLDGLSSHFKSETIKFAKDHGSFACHPTQPTNVSHWDCSSFGLLKVQWRDVCHSFHKEHPTTER